MISSRTRLIQPTQKAARLISELYGNKMKRITIDTNILPLDDIIVDVCKKNGYEYTVVSVTEREVEGSDFEKDIDDVPKIPETAVWNESPWGNAVWPDKDNSFEEIIDIISSGSFPKDRSNLTDAQKRMLRDAMILEAHVREKRDIFITNDKRAFINHGRRERIENKFGTKILTKTEFLEKYSNRVQ